MVQITLYLDKELEARLRAAAKAANLSQSRWVTNLIREKLDNEWPAEVVSLPAHGLISRRWMNCARFRSGYEPGSGFQSFKVTAT